MEIFEVLADPTRRRILELLASADRSAGELAGEFEISQPGVSRHLRVLREARVVSARPEGQRRLYRLEPTALRELSDWVTRRRRDWERRLDALEDHLSRKKRRDAGGSR